MSDGVGIWSKDELEELLKEMKGNDKAKINYLITLILDCITPFVQKQNELISSLTSQAKQKNMTDSIWKQIIYKYTAECMKDLLEFMCKKEEK